MRVKKYPDKLAIAARRHLKEKNYWINKLSMEPGKSCFPYDYEKVEDHDPGESENLIGKVEFHFQKEILPRLISLSNYSDVNLYLILTAALNVLLSRYSGNKNIVIGTPIYKQDIERDIINTVLALKTRLESGLTFKDLLLQVRETVDEAVENYNYPIQVLADDLGLPFSEQNFLLFDVILLLKNIHDREYIRHIDVNMIFSFEKKEDMVCGTVEYNTLRYTKTTIERIISHFINLMNSVVPSIEIPVNSIDILSGEEKLQLLREFNKAGAAYPDDKLIHEFFEKQAAEIPGKIALVHEDKSVSYQELNNRANRLASILRKKGVRPGVVVGLLIDRSIEMIIGILGTLKAGGIYLPIEIGYPRERILYILNDCNVAFLLCTKSVMKSFSYTDFQGIGLIKVEPFLTDRRPQILDFDSLPIPDRALINYSKYCNYIGHALVKHAITLQGTRGCPYNCSYCHKIWPKSHVIRSAESILEEVKRYYDMGIKRFSFVDDIFNLDVKNSSRFFNSIIRKGWDIQILFPGGLRGDIMTKDYIDMMVEAGTIDIAIALETASPRLQKLIKKNLDIEKLRENAEYICKKHPQIVMELFTMHGFPTETEEEAVMTLDFLKSLHWVDFPSLSVLNIYPNTDMAKLAVVNGISMESIIRSEALQFHEVPETLPFDKSFTIWYQTEYLTGYFLSKERLLAKLPFQMKLLTEDEIVQKYHSYLPFEIRSFSDLLRVANITEEELGAINFKSEESLAVLDLNEKLKKYSTRKNPQKNALKIMHLDLSQYFSGERQMLFDMVDPPLGLLYIVTHLNETFGDRVDAKILKSRLDFDSYAELRMMLQEFDPDIIAVRSLIFYKDFFHETLALIKDWGFDVPIITGGPYATSSYRTILQDGNVDLIVLGEGERTYGELIEAILKNNGRIPDENVLQEIPGLAYIPGRKDLKSHLCREIISLDTYSGLVAEQAGKNPVHLNNPADGAYIIYTSGTTGKPKGVLIDHHNVVRLMFNDKFNFDFNAADVWTMFHSYNFDFSVWEMYGALLYGGKLIIIPQDTTRDMVAFSKVLVRESVTILNQTPTVFYKLSNEELSKNGRLLNIRNIIFGGEALKPAKLEYWVNKYPQIKLINMFGITETTVHVTYKELGEKEICGDIDSIGRPIPTLNIYVMDESLNLLPIRSAGELYVGGEGVGTGYLNKPELTAERFIENPYKRGERLYKSGDLVRFIDNGELEYLGRIDNQVKIRGFRIEVEEVEEQLALIENIESSVVIVKEKKDNEKYLCAYFTSNREVETSELRNSLSRVLPEQYIPAFFYQLKDMPITANGKIDKKTLIEYEDVNDSWFIGPRNRLEEELADLWAKILEIDKKKIGRDSNFFELGGHSLNSIELISSINKHFNIALSYSEMFSNSTFKDLSSLIESAERSEHSSIRAVEKKEYYDLSSAQKRLFFIQQLDPKSTSYNLPMIQIFEDSIDKAKSESVFKKLIARHEGLRTGFELIDDWPVQRIVPQQEVEFSLDYLKAVSTDEAKNVIVDFIKPFDLSRVPLLRVVLLNVEGNRQQFMIDMHHIISDGVTYDILVKEFLGLYMDEELPDIELHYKDYSEWQKSSEHKKTQKTQEDYWIKMFAGGIPELPLPLDYDRPLLRSWEGSKLYFEIGSDDTRGLKTLAKKFDATMFMMLLACFNILLSRISGREDVVIGVPAAGRSHADLNGIIGMFVNTLALRNRPVSSRTFSEFIAELRDNTLEAFENQDYQFDELVKKLGLTKDSSRNPIFDVVFAFQSFKGAGAGIRTTVDENHPSFIPGFNLAISHFDLLLIASEASDKLVLIFEYSTKLFKEQTIRSFIDYFKRIVSAVLTDSTQKLSDIEMISRTENVMPSKKMGVEIGDLQGNDDSEAEFFF